MSILGRAEQTTPLDGVDPFPPGTLKYMGSKRSLVPVLAPRLAALCVPGETVVDLFAGTHAVGYAMRRRNHVVGVDTQGYSRVVGSALLRDRIDCATPEAVLARLRPHIESHQSATLDLYGRTLSTEGRLLTALTARDLSEVVVDAYAEFQGRLPDPSAWTDSAPLPRAGSFARRLRDLVELRRTQPDEFPYLLMTMYYANAYFGVAQAIMLDGVRYAIDQEFNDGPGADVCLTALLSAASHCTSTPGHFAMWRVVRTPAGARDIAKFRVRDPLAYFMGKLKDVMNIPPSGLYRHDVVTADALGFIQSYDGAVGVAYVDPPYSPVHYSRFYHVLEELVDYDYPPVYFGGRFPAGRYSSRWSVRSQAADAFAELLDALAQRGWPTVISYGSSGVVGEGMLVSLCEGAFGNGRVEVDHVTTRHASMGRADRGARSTHELLLTCRPRRHRAHAVGSRK